MRSCRRWASGIPFILFSILLGTASGGFCATTNLWTNSVSGLWRDGTNWSSNQPPDSTFNFILITNAGSKTVTIDSATAAANLAIRRLTVSAPGDALNTLQLTDLDTNQPLQLSSTLTVGPGGVINVSNSAVSIDGTLGGLLNVTAGSVNLGGGLIDCSTVTITKIGNANGSSGTLILNGGTMLAQQLKFGAAVGSQGALNQSNGLLNCSSLVSLGDSLNSTGIVFLAGGQLIATNDITKVGNIGCGQMTIAGGSANFAFLNLGENAGSAGTLLVTGGLLVLTPRTTNDWLGVGNFGNGQLTICGGTNLLLSALHVADNISSTGIVSVTGGQLTVTNALCAIGRYGVGQMTISNATVLTADISVGRHDGAIGTLTLQTNAVLTQLDDLSVARFANSVGHVVMTGGVLSLANSDIRVGRGGSGDMTLSNGTARALSGLVAVSTVEPEANSGLLVTNAPIGTLTIAGGVLELSSNLLVGTASISTGQVVVAGGSLAVGGGASPGYLSIASGSCSLSRGSIATDNLFLTNNTGQFVFNAGTLQAKNMTVSNSFPFVVGDGIEPATLQLQGGIYSFADGLVVASNAVITGCGTIRGSITNYGVIATNCQPAISITSIAKTGPSVTLSFTTVNGSNHVVEYNNAVGTTNWTAILPGVIGNGGVMAETDTNATSPSRFYRIHLQ